LNPFEAARTSGDVVGHAKRQQRVASAADELGDFLGRAALAIGQLDSGYRAGNCGAMRGL
jgi:hypothetical protein